MQIAEGDISLMEDRPGRGGERLNPDGNERLTAAVGLVLLILTIIELGTIVFGLHQFLSLHVFVGFVLIPPVLLKLASTAGLGGVPRLLRKVVDHFSAVCVKRLRGKHVLQVELVTKPIKCRTNSL